MFDLEHFIIEISEENSIWNTKSKEYHDKIAKHVSWSKVAKATINDFDTLEEKEKRTKIIDLQKKWKNLRDTYKKKCISKSGQAANKKKKYIYSEILEFLRPTMENRKTEGNFDDDDESEEDIEDDLDKDQDGQDEIIDRDLTTDSTIISLDNFQNVGIKKSKSKCSNLTTKKVNFEEELLRSLKNKQEEDPDFSFLKSLLPQIKTISEDKKPTLYIELLKTIQRVKNGPPENMQPVYYDRPSFSQNQNQMFSGEYSQAPPMYGQLQPIHYTANSIYPDNTGNTNSL